MGKSIFEIRCPKCNSLMDLKALPGKLIQQTCKCGYKKTK